MSVHDPSASATQPVYEINDGVRRAKAVHLAGRKRIPANVGGTFAIENIPVDQLRSSPIKPAIDITPSGKKSDGSMYCKGL
jgi:hypothetical protein